MFLPLCHQQKDRREDVIESSLFSSFIIFLPHCYQQNDRRINLFFKKTTRPKTVKENGDKCRTCFLKLLRVDKDQIKQGYANMRECLTVYNKIRSQKVVLEICQKVTEKSK